MKTALLRIWNLYYDGFKSMTIGRSLWAIILIKLFVLFAVLKLFFFPNILQERYDNDADRASAVRANLSASPHGQAEGAADLLPQHGHSGDTRGTTPR